MKTITEFNNGILEVSLHGELDHHAAGETVREIELSLDTHLPRECVIDFKGVTFMDSSGIAVLIKTRRRMDELCGKLRVVNVPDRPRRIFDAAGLGRIIDIQSREVHS